jgi:hypothetical protein
MTIELIESGAYIPVMPIRFLSLVSVQEQLLLGVPNSFQCAGIANAWCPILVFLILSSVQEHILIGVPF